MQSASREERPGWLEGADMTTPLVLLPTGERFTVDHGVWLYSICRAYNGIRHAGGVALPGAARRRLQAEIRAVLMRRPPLRRQLWVR